MLAFLSQAHIEPDLTIEMFLMDGPVPGFDALELVEPRQPRASEDPMNLARSFQLAAYSI